MRQLLTTGEWRPSLYTRFLRRFVGLTEEEDLHDSCREVRNKKFGLVAFDFSVLNRFVVQIGVQFYRLVRCSTVLVLCAK